MKYVYYILVCMLLSLVGMQSPLAAAAAAAATPYASALEEGMLSTAPTLSHPVALPQACQQALDMMRITFISRYEYMQYMDAHRKSLLATLPVHITPETLDAEGGIWRGFIETMERHWQIVEKRIETIQEAKYDLSQVRDLLNTVKWMQFVMNENREHFEHDCPNLLALAPEIKRIYRNDAEILGDAVGLLLPCMSPEYQLDFARSFLSHVVPAEGATKGVMRSKVSVPGVVRDGTEMQIITSLGARMVFPLSELRFIRVKGTKKIEDAGKIFLLMVEMKSGFNMYCAQLIKDEADMLMHATNEAFHAYEDEIATAKKHAAAERERAAALAKRKAARDRKRGGSSASMGGGAGAKAVERSDFELTGDPEIDAAIIALNEKDAARGAPGSGKKCSGADGSAMPLDLGASGEACEDSAETDREAALRVTRQLIAAMGSRGASSMPAAREYSTKTGLNPDQKVILRTLLGIPLEGTIIPDINTLTWDNLVDFLKGLGFKRTTRDTFMDNKQRRIHLHALHYDDYRLNHKLLKILTRQLEYYGFTEDKLKELLPAT